MNRAIFFDRDGTLLVEVGYLVHPSLVVPYSFALEALSTARRKGFLLIAVTNQSGIAKGYLSESDLSLIHERMQEIFRAGGAELDAIYYCPHHPQGTVETYRKKCSCRKPGTDLGHIAASMFGIDLQRSFVVGDKESDLLFGRSLKARACLVRTGYGICEERRLGKRGLDGFRVFDNVLAAVTWITEDGEG